MGKIINREKCFDLITGLFYTINMIKGAKKMKQKKKNERNWFSLMLWADKKEIQESVKKYDETPWYLSLRFGLLCFVFFLSLLTTIFMKQFSDYIISLIMIFFPLGYFVMRGYRFSYVLIGLVKLYDSIMRLFVSGPFHVSNGPQVWSVLIWTVIWLGLCISCYRIESLRRIENPDTNRITKLDKVFFGIFGLVALFFAYGFYLEKTDPRFQLENKYGVQNVEVVEDLYMHVVSVPQLCESSWQKAADEYNKGKKEKVSVDILTQRYINRYLAVNEKILEKIPEILITEFRSTLGEKTTKNLNDEMIKSGHKIIGKPEMNSDMYYSLCLRLLGTEDENLKINITQ